MSVRYTETALRGLEEIFAYVANRNPRAATAVVVRTEQAISRIGDFVRWDI